MVIVCTGPHADSMPTFAISAQILVSMSLFLASVKKETNLMTLVTVIDVGLVYIKVMKHISKHCLISLY